jgi:hypothetical protein
MRRLFILVARCEVKIKSQGKVINKTMYLAFGVGMHGLADALLISHSSAARKFIHSTGRVEIQSKIEKQRLLIRACGF